MKTSLSILACIVLTTYPRAEERAALPEPGPEGQGLRMRLVVAPRAGVEEEGFDVRVDLLNTSKRAVTLTADWRDEAAGDLKDYIDAATSIECVPAVRRWLGGVRAGRRESPQPDQVLEAGEVLSVRWQTRGRHLKNRVSNPNDVQNPEFPFPGLYSVHATVTVITDAGTVRLRSNEQLVQVGGSREMPRFTLGQLLEVASDGKTALVNLGSLQKVRPGDEFEYFSKREQGKITITTVKPDYSVGTLQVLSSIDSRLPLRGTEVSLVPRRNDEPSGESRRVRESDSELRSPSVRGGRAGAR